MKIGNFLFPQAETPDLDGPVIDATLAEAALCDELGMDVLWLAEHHFDGNCAYVDPVSFAAALAVATKRIKLAFGVAQMSLHHPIRLAEQLALIDHLSKGRLIVGLGRGTAHNIYDYRGFGIPPEEAEERLLEAEQIMLESWTTENYVHNGKYWQLRLPKLRPQPYTQPHPYVIRACSGEASTLEMARQGKPFLMNVQSDEVTENRMVRYRQTMQDAGYDEAHVAQAMAETWVLRHILVAETDQEAERLALRLFDAQRVQRAKMRQRIAKEWGESMAKPGETGVAPGAGVEAARNVVQHSVIYGSPATVAERLARIEAMGVGGLILQFRIGPSPNDVTENSIRLFMDKVRPEVSQAAA